MIKPFTIKHIRDEEGGAKTVFFEVTRVEILAVFFLPRLQDKSQRGLLFGCPVVEWLSIGINAADVANV